MGSWKHFDIHSSTSSPQQTTGAAISMKHMDGVLVLRVPLNSVAHRLGDFFAGGFAGSRADK
ncbi:hypothetical protein P775_14585 [Puniceibacterium antarcticum]|uniref:Uncharacterized protein n=2 Tax=Puniceibacterium antarcticum TaxID=1206336 RepID=A0A2G8RCU9_9RHOB|nr:hypothetical protein P775_14585 [Puniceibacterium antarcticum]